MSVAKKFIDNVLINGVFKDDNSVHLPGDLNTYLTSGEIYVLSVFKECIPYREYYSLNSGLPIMDKFELLRSDIDSGFYDYLLFSDYEAYSNIRAQKETANLAKLIFSPYKPNSN